MAAKRSKGSGGRVTPKGSSSSAAPGRSARQRRVSWVAAVLVALILAGLVAGALGTALLDTSTTVPQPSTEPGTP